MFLISIMQEHESTLWENASVHYECTNLPAYQLMLFLNSNYIKICTQICSWYC